MISRPGLDMQIGLISTGHDSVPTAELPQSPVPNNANINNINIIDDNYDTDNNYRVSHITGPTLFLLFSRVLEHIQRNFS